MMRCAPASLERALVQQERKRITSRTLAGVMPAGLAQDWYIVQACAAYERERELRGMREAFDAINAAARGALLRLAHKMRGAR